MHYGTSPGCRFLFLMSHRRAVSLYMNNNITFLKAVYKLLSDAGIQVVVFGGWAEELQCVVASRPHKDVDLLYEAEDFTAVDAFLATHEEEYEGGHCMGEFVI